MNDNPELKISDKKPNKARVWRNTWLVSIAIFIISFVLFIVGFMGGDGTDLSTLSSLSVITIFLSIPIGGISFFVWLFVSGNKIIKTILLGLISCVFLFVFIFVFILKSTKVYGNSMSPLFNEGEYFLINKLGSLKRQDVVDYKKDNEEFVGRIVGLPNETIFIKPGEIRINDQTIDEPYADWSGWSENREQEITLGNDEYLVLYDKRNGNIQVVKRESVLGKFFYRYWPSSRAGLI